ncbi:CopD family protein [Sphingomonas sp. R-74633]|uniref:CopD family protein n=1 Tax=Sphingomonas sp. R-74633 TaxID=2751188 RepID=UPI0015D32A83|nr:CopD family protein [Sphingomonas sp. R-74633]
MPYLWMKAAHVASVLIFIGGLFSQSFAVAAARRGDAAIVALAHRWDRRVTVPAMLAVWLTGAMIAAEGAWFASPWLWPKLALVLVLTGLHGVQSGLLRQLRRGQQPNTRLHGVMVAAFISAAVIFIAALVVVKPF